MRGIAALQDALLAQRGHLFPWIAVAYGTGIGIFFLLRFEPGWPHHVGVAVAGLAAAALGRLLGAVTGPFALAMAVVAAGFVHAGWRAHAVAEPVLGFRYYGPIEGRVVDIDRSSSDLPRLLLDRVVLADVSPARTPARVRVSATGDQPWLPMEPGAVVILTGHLSPPSGPTEPGDFDFRRHVWFEGLGGVGYTATPILTLRPGADGQGGLAVNRLRLVLSGAIMDRVPGDAGGYAAAVMTGDRSGMTEAANQVMRDSNLYHLVSISGTHMALLVAFVFGLIRFGVALVPPVALRVSAKKVAAAVALPVAAFYLALAGRDMATERAFVMVAVALVAILLDRQALTLRSVAIAALIVLAMRPEALLNPGFQMSFAASAALVAVFAEARALPRNQSVVWRWLMPVAILAMSSIVAGTATAPFAAAHFNRVAHYGLVANLLAGPAMAFLVMPGGVILAVLGPLGLDQPAVWMIDFGARFILWVAGWIAAMPGSVSAVITPPDAVLPLFALGGVFVMLWKGRARWGGLALPMAAMVLWFAADRPVLLVAETGGLVGLMTDDGRVLSKATGDSYVAENWLENDGETVMQEAAHARPGMVTEARVTRISLQGAEVLHVTGKVAFAAIADCGGADLLISNVVADPGVTRNCDVFDLTRLRETGAIAARVEDGAIILVTAADLAGDRLWTR